MSFYPKSVERLIEELAKLPGIGEKSAQRMAFYLIESDKRELEDLARSISEISDTVHSCPNCYSITDDEVCSICSDPSRDQSILCVVEDTKDLYAIERTKEFNGLYHVLHGLISPLEGIGPQDIKSRELIERLKNLPIKEVIMATNPSPEGEATAMYLRNLIAPAGIKVTRLAKGVPIGADMEYVDEITLSRALQGRIEIS